MTNKTTRLVILTLTVLAMVAGSRRTDSPKLSRMTDSPKSKVVRDTDSPKLATDSPKRTGGGPSPRDIVGSEVTFG